jgi:hypothetical protein
MLIPESFGKSNSRMDLMDSREIIGALGNVVDFLPFTPKDGDIVSYNGISSLILYRYSKSRNLWCFVRRHDRLTTDTTRWQYGQP